MKMGKFCLGYVCRLDFIRLQLQKLPVYSPLDKSQSKHDMKKYLLDLETDSWFILESYLKFLKKIEEEEKLSF